MAVDKSSQRVRRMFGQIAGRYDLLNHLLSLNLDRYWRWRTTKLARAATGPVLDVCCGTGDLTLAYYRAGARRVSVIGSDFCHEMLVRGEAKARSRGINGQVSFVEADAEQLPFANDQFEVVSVAFGLRNVQNTDAGLAEMVRVCRPGGRVAILEFSEPTWGPWKAVYGWYFRNVLPRIGQWLAKNHDEAYHYLPASVSEFPTGDALADRLRQQGLRDVRFWPLTLGVATLHVGTK